MRRPCDGGGIGETLVSSRFCRRGENWFTVPLGEPITIASSDAAARAESKRGTNGPRRGRPRARTAQGEKLRHGDVRRGRPLDGLNEAAADQANCFWRKDRAPSARGGERGRRRTRQDQIPPKAKQPLVKLRTFEKDPHRTKKACFFCRTGFEGANAFQSDDPAV